MYSVRPGNKAYLIGNTIGALATGIGMRWRESVVEIVEKRPSPHYELDNLRRVTLPNSAITLLTDLGVTENILRRNLRLAKGWRFVTGDSLASMREGDSYSGCAPSEPVFHITEGHLTRVLRGEFLRFGGTVSWGTEAFDPFEAQDASGLWFMRKQYGPATDADVILSWSKSNVHFKKEVFADNPDAIGVLFDVQQGVCKSPSPEIRNLFGKDFDVVMALGATIALHMWLADGNNTISWRLVGKGNTEQKDAIAQLHPAIQSLISSSSNRKYDSETIQGTTPTFRDDMQHVRVSVCGDALLPVDPFEWRGDKALTSIHEATSLIRSFYGRKFGRGHVPQQLRDFEQDSLASRANLLKRDLQDAEYFLSVRPQLPKDEDDEEQLKRVGSTN